MGTRLLLLITTISSFTHPGFGDDTCFVFSFFRDNGQDGFFLMHSNDGLTWEPLNHDEPLLPPYVGEAQLMRDPCIILGPDGLFHMVWTVGWWEKSIGIASSPDLVHWSKQRTIPVMEHEPNARNSWAPEIFYDEENEEYVIFWATTIPGRFPDTEGSSETDLNHRMYYVTSSDLQRFSETRVLLDPGFNVIDSTINRLPDGRYVMFLKNETLVPEEKNIRMAFSDHPTGPWSEISKPISGEPWAEGPTAAFIDGYWYVYFDRYTKHEYAVVRSADLQTWEDVSDQLTVPEGLRHGSILPVDCSVVERIRALTETP